jgi:hypothetical protein
MLSKGMYTLMQPRFLLRQSSRLLPGLLLLLLLLSAQFLLHFSIRSRPQEALLGPLLPLLPLLDRLGHRPGC